MALGYSPATVTTGLVAVLDVANQKSYGGVNVLAAPNNFTGSGWANSSVTVTAGATTTPDGTSATSVTEIAASAQHFLELSYGTVVIGEVFTWSASFKNNTNVTGIVLHTNGEGTATFTFSTGTYVLSGAGTLSASMTSEGNGWWRCAVTFKKANTVGSFYIANQRGIGIYTGDATYSYYVAKAQLQTNNKVTQYSAATGVDTVWYDMSGNALNGTFSNSPFYDNSNSGSLSFNGTNASVNMPSSSLLQFLNRTSYSFEVWAYPRTDASASYPGFINRESNPGSGRDGYNLYYTKVGIAAGSNYVATERWGTGTATNIGTTLTDAVFFNNWHCFCTTYDGSTLSFYRNGALVNSAASVQNVTNTAQVVTIGQRGGVYSDSKIATTRFYNISLTATQVAQNFNALRGRYGV
jgi:hypothetical protein